MKEISVFELKLMIDGNEEFQLIDVREQYEYDQVNIGAEHIPMGEIMDNVGKISKSKKVIIHCRSGARSGSVINELEIQFRFDNLYNLKGGILAYANLIDPSLSK